MLIKVTCPHCDAVNKVSDDKAGKKVRCKECDKPINVPANDADKKPTVKSAKTKKGGAPVLLIVLGVGALLLLLLCIGGSVGGYFVFMRTSTVVGTKKDKSDKGDDKGGGDPIANPSGPKPPVELKTSLGGACERLAISPDGKYAIVGGTFAANKINVQLWNLQEKRKINDYSTANGIAQAVAISPDGKFAAFTDQLGNTTLIDVAKGNKLRDLFPKTNPTANTSNLRFSPKGDLVVLAAARRVIAWDMTGKETMNGLNATADISAMSPFFEGGKKFATGDAQGGIQIWDIGQPAPVKFLSHPRAASVSVLAVSPDSKTVYSSLSSNLELYSWELTGFKYQSVKLRDPHFGPSDAALLMPDGKRLVYLTSKVSIAVADIGTGANLAEFGHTKGATSQTTALALTADGSTVVSLSRDNTLKIWDIRD
jgi:predicted Zn finger-like uncharacterized protein